MAKNSVRDYDATNANNTDIQSIDISEGCSPAGINNAIREVMADLKDVSTGAVALESPSADSLTVTGDLTVDTNTLYVDSTNNRVGVGTASPTYQLQLSSDDPRIAMTDTTHGTWFTSVGYGGGNDYSINQSGVGTRLLVDSSGNVGIGTSSPNALLDLLATTNTIRLGRSTSSYATIDSNSSAGSLAFNADAGNIAGGGAMYFSFAGSEAMRIDSSGNVAINTTSPNTSYQTTIQSNSTKGALSIDGPATNGYWAAEWDMPSGSTYGIQFKNGGSTVGSVRINASSTTYNTSSDYRLKENVTADWDATTRLKQLNPVRFNFIAEPDITVDGFLAHEVQDIVPEAISGTKDAMRDEEYEVTPAVLDEDGNEVTPAVMGTRSVPEYQGIDQSKLVPLLVKTIQELEARITALEAN